MSRKTNTAEDLDTHPIIKLLQYLPNITDEEFEDIVKKTKEKIFVKEMKSYYRSDICHGSSSRADQIFGGDEELKDIKIVAQKLKERTEQVLGGIFCKPKPNNERASAKVFCKYQKDLIAVLEANKNGKNPAASAAAGLH